MSIDLYRGNGEVRPFRNAEYLPAFYFLPKGMLEVLPEQVRNLPRKVLDLVDDDEAVALVESDFFLKCLWAAYGTLIWPFMGNKEYPEIYSGYDPVYLLSHWMNIWIDGLEEEGYLQPVEALFQKQSPYGEWVWTDEAAASALEDVVPKVMEKYHMAEIMAVARSNPCFEDFDFRRSRQKASFVREWYHIRTKHPMVSLEEMQKDYARAHNGQQWDTEDYEADVEGNTLSQVQVEQFMATLTEKDRQLLTLRMEGLTLEEIAKELGFKNHSGVQKRIRKIGLAYEKFAGKDLGF